MPAVGLGAGENAGEGEESVKKSSNVGLLLLLLLAVLSFSYLWNTGESPVSLEWSQVVELFEKEQVESFRCGRHQADHEPAGGGGWQQDRHLSSSMTSTCSMTSWTSW